MPGEAPPDTHAPPGYPPARQPTAERLRLLLVLGHAAIRDALAFALAAEPDVDEVREAGSIAEARPLLDQVDVALVDLTLPDGDGADLIDDLRGRNPHAEALVLAANAERSDAASAVERGAAGVLTEQSRLPDVVEAVRRVCRGEAAMPLDEVVDLLRLAARLRERERDDRRRLEGLTVREHEVLQLLASGVEPHAAAARLCISPRTHRNHVANVLMKLGVHSQLQAVLFALRYGAVGIGRPDGPG